MAATVSSLEGPGAIMGTTTVQFSDVEDIGAGWPGTNLNLNPQFKNPSARNLRLKQASPCVDAAADTILPADHADLDDDGNTTGENTPLDFSGTIPRELNEPNVVDTGVDDLGAGNDANSPDTGINDMGCHERQVAIPPA